MSTQVRERVSRPEARLARVAKLPFGLNAGEVIAALVGIALLVWLMVYYFTSLKPEQDRLHTLQAEFDAQQRDIIASAKPVDQDQRSPSDMAKDAVESLEAFKTGHLKPFSSGRIALIKEVNALAKKNSVTLTSGIDMFATMVESSAEGDKANAKSDKKSSSTRKKSDEIFNAFPSVSFRFTVFGQYSNARAFISDLEREKQFLVIDSISLTNQEGRTASRRSRGEGLSGIMLTIEMSAYFQPM